MHFRCRPNEPSARLSPTCNAKEEGTCRVGSLGLAALYGADRPYDTFIIHAKGTRLCIDDISLSERPSVWLPCVSCAAGQPVMHQQQCI